MRSSGVAVTLAATAGADRCAFARGVAGSAMMSQPLDLLAKCDPDPEAAIDRSETHVGISSKVPVLHYELAERPRSHFALAEERSLCRMRPALLECSQGGLRALPRAFACRHAISLIERFARCERSPDHERHHEFGCFKGTETLRAGEALAPPSNLLARSPGANRRP